MRRTLAAAVMLSLVLAGCATTPEPEKLPPPSGPSGASQVVMTKEKDGRFLAFIGPRQQHSGAFLGVDDTNYFCLRSWMDTQTGEVAHQLYVENSYYGTPNHWTGAQQSDGTTLNFIPISRNEISCDEGCSYADEFAAVLPDDLMRAKRDGGLSVTFIEDSGKSLAITVPPRFIAEQLAAIDATRSALAANAKPEPIPPASAP
jgi:hypothetical protein